MPMHNSMTGVLSYLHLPIPSFSILLYEKSVFRNSFTLNIGDKWVESLLVIGKPCVPILVRTSVISATGWATGELWFASRRETSSLLLRIVQTASDVRSARYFIGTEAISLGIKRPEREADHSSPSSAKVNPLKPELNSICYLLALLGAYHFLHVSRIRVKLLTIR